MGLCLNEFVFAHHVSSPLSLIREAWSSEIDTYKNLLQYATDFKIHLNDTIELARENLKNGPREDERVVRSESPLVRILSLARSVAVATLPRSHPGS